MSEIRITIAPDFDTINALDCVKAVIREGRPSLANRIDH